MGDMIAILLLLLILLDIVIIALTIGMMLREEIKR